MTMAGAGEMTPAEHRARAEAALARSAGIDPTTDLCRNLVLTSLAHTLAAVAAYLEPPPVPQIPGLPSGYTLDTRQAPGGERKWAYVLAFPDNEFHATRFRWEASETALAAGIRHAARHATIRHAAQNGDPG
jgi:hypothetical protein